jgi:nucleotide-binding universal stress UspA family protein
MKIMTRRESMSLLVGYDESDCSRAMIESLAGAGLPARGSAVVTSVAETVALATTLGYGYPAAGPDDITQRILLVKECADRATEDGAALLRRVLPNWEISDRPAEGSPYWSLIADGERNAVDLIAVGSHGRSALGRAVLGSTSQFVVTHAAQSVRVGRAPAPSQSPGTSRLLIALDGSESADAVVEEVARRSWSAGTEARIIVAVDVGTAVSIRSRSANEPDRAHPALPEGVLERAAATLERAGLKLGGELKEGDPKHVILERAQFWDVDTIFVGAQGHSRFPRMSLGSVSASVAARAHCSVEVVRRNDRQPSTENPRSLSHAASSDSNT